jgi:hypothetical protein
MDTHVQPQQYMFEHAYRARTFPATLMLKPDMTGGIWTLNDRPPLMETEATLQRLVVGD